MALFYGCSSNYRHVELASYSSTTEVLARENWPLFMLELEQAAKVAGIETDTLITKRVFHDEYFFKCESESLFELMVTYWKLSSLSDHPAIMASFEKRIADIVETSDGYYFANPNVHDGEKGQRIVLFHSSNKSIVVGHAYFNF
jgi:hypothetical protein